jgi:hypothetical protein
VREFEKASGFKIGGWDGKDRGSAVKLVMELERRREGVLSFAKGWHQRIKALDTSLSSAITEYEKTED